MEHDELTLKRMWEIFSPKVKSYLGQDWVESEGPHIQKQIMKALSTRKDGYGMARELERDGWEEDRDLMELMDDAESALRQAHKELLKQWIEVYQISPSRKIGDRVGTTHWFRKGQIGTVVKVYEDEAKYGIRFSDQGANSHQILTYEEVVDCPHEREDHNPNGAGECEQLHPSHALGTALQDSGG